MPIHDPVVKDAASHAVNGWIRPRRDEPDGVHGWRDEPDGDE